MRAIGRWQMGYLGMTCAAVIGCGATDVANSESEVETSAATFEALRGHRERPPWIEQALRAGANRLCDLQADHSRDNARNGLDDEDPDDGGWDWLIPVSSAAHTAEISPENLYGGTALALWATREALGFRWRWATGESDAAQGMAARGDVDSPPDIVYLVALSAQTHRRTFSELARIRYEARVHGDATAHGATIRDGRHRDGHDGLIAYDLAWLSLAASALHAAFPGAGYERDAAAFAQVVVDDLAGTPGYFDAADSNENFYVQGLAWSLVALTDAASDTRALRRALRAQLLAFQNEDGGWGWSSQYLLSDAQATAHTVQALSLTERHPSTAAYRGARWLASEQLPSGGFAYTADRESPLLDADILLALYLLGDGHHSREIVPSDGVSARRSALEISAELPPLGAPASR